MWKKIILIVATLMIFTNLSIAQNTNNQEYKTTEFISNTSEAPIQANSSEPEMAKKFREEGKIYVVVGVAGIILCGIFVFLFMLERRIKSIENQ